MPQKSMAMEHWALLTYKLMQILSNATTSLALQIKDAVLRGRSSRNSRDRSINGMTAAQQKCRHATTVTRGNQHG